MLMRRTIILALATAISGCAPGIPGDPAAGFDADDPTGTYEFTTVTIEGERVTGDLFVEGLPGDYRARAVIPRFVPLEFPSVRTDGQQMTLEGDDPMGNPLRIDLSFEGAEFSGVWEMMGQSNEISGRILPNGASAGRAERVAGQAPEAPRIGALEELHEELQRRGSEGTFSGVVLVADGGEIVFHRAYGVAELRGMRPVMQDTRFDIGSLDKLFTSVVVLRLAQEGRLDLDAPLASYIEDLGDDGHRITVRHLLQFRSGLGDYLAHPAFRENPGRFRTVSDFMELVRDEPLQFEPGEGQRYSNSGFVVLGAVIEAVTGRDYHEVVREMVLDPAGMRATGPRPDAASAVRYTRDGRGNPVSADDRWPPVASPAGGSFSTAADLHRFLNAFMEDRLLERAYTDTFLRGFAGPDGEPVDRQGPWDVDWGGGAAGLNASIGFVPSSGRIFAVLANLDPPAAEEVGRAILRMSR